MKKTRNIFKTYPEMQKVEFTEEQLKFKLFVGGLDPDVTSSDLGKFFSAFGKISGVKIVGEATGKSRGFGFVVFKDFRSIKNSIEGDHYINNRLVDYMPCKESGLEGIVKNKKKATKSAKKVFISHLPKEVTKAELFDYFSDFAEVIEILVIIRKKRPNAFAYITLDEKANLLKIVNQDHKLRCGKNFKAEAAVPKSEPKQNSKTQKKSISGSKDSEFSNKKSHDNFEKIPSKKNSFKKVFDDCITKNHRIFNTKLNFNCQNNESVLSQINQNQKVKKFLIKGLISDRKKRSLLNRQIAQQGHKYESDDKFKRKQEFNKLFQCKCAELCSWHGLDMRHHMVSKSCFFHHSQNDSNYRLNRSKNAIIKSWLTGNQFHSKKATFNQ